MLTLGIEEEVQVVDGGGQLAVHDLGDDPRALVLAEGELGTEIHRCAIELKTRVCRDVAGLVAALAGLRAHARRRAARCGQALIIAGLHPLARGTAQPMHLDAGHRHYRALVAEYQDVARAACSFGMHLHIGLPAGMPRMPVMNRLRHVLPEALALSASAPIVAGRDTGLQSWRHSLLDRYPRMGIPDAWDSDVAYRAHVDHLRRAGCIEPTQGLWQDLRLHHHYGTLEVRIMDATPSLRRIGLIATLLAWETRAIIDELAHGGAVAPWPRALIEENKWRARRHGLQARWIDWSRDETCTTAERFARWWTRLARYAPHAQARRYWARELADAIDAGTFADRLRAQVARRTGWADTLAWMVAESHGEPPLLRRMEALS